MACRWRLYNLDRLSKAHLDDIDDRRLVATERPPDALPLVRRFSAPFVRRVGDALNSGRLSVKRAASLLGLPLVALEELLRDYGIDPCFEA